MDIITTEHQKEDQWLIYRIHIETAFPKYFTIQDVKKRLTGRNNGLNVNKEIQSITYK